MRSVIMCLVMFLLFCMLHVHLYATYEGATARVDPVKGGAISSGHRQRYPVQWCTEV